MLKLQWRRTRSRYPWLQMVHTWRFWLLVVFTGTMLAYAIISFKRKPIAFFNQEIKELWLGNMEFDFQTGLHFLKEGNNVYLRGSMPDAQQLNGLPNHCGVYNVSNYLCASWYPKVKLEVEYVAEEHASCHVLTWRPLFGDYKPHTCFSLADFSWYGGSLLYDQTWPLNKADIPLQLYQTHDLESYKGETNTFGNVLDWFWLSSSGVAVIVDNAFPVHVSVNQSGDKLICVYSKSVDKPVLKYTVCKSSNLRKIQRYVISKYIQLPLSLPKDSYFSDPMWSTNPLFRNTLNQHRLQMYCQAIKDKVMEGSLIDVNANGIAVLRTNPFDKDKFPNSNQLLMILRSDLNLEIFLPISPFVPVTDNIDGLKLIKDVANKPLVLHFENEEVNVVNLLDDEAVDWYVGQVSELTKEFSINGLHLVGGVADNFNFSNSVLESVNVEKLSRHFATSVAEKLKLPTMSEFASQSQKGGLIIKLTSRESSWGSIGGLKSLIPSVLTLNLLGYPFVIPNTVGGPGTVRSVNTSYSEEMKPDRELYARWMGISAFMPCMMFSYPPWLYDAEMVTWAKQFIKQHKEVVAPLVIKAAREYEHSGSPIVRPLWWLDPHDPTSLTIDDEYLIGDSLLVAPIVEAGMTHRDIYIPQGKWRDTINDIEVEPGTWLRNYLVPLHQVATFTKVKSRKLM